MLKPRPKAKGMQYPIWPLEEMKVGEFFEFDAAKRNTVNATMCKLHCKGKGLWSIRRTGPKVLTLWRIK